MANASIALSKASAEYKGLEKRASDKYGSTVNAVGNQSISRYFSALRIGRREIVKTFSEQELNFMLDLFNGTAFTNTEIDVQGLRFSIEDASDDYEGYASKWQIDYLQILNKFDTLGDFARLALIDFIEFFWHSHENSGGLEPHKVLREM